MLTKQVIKCFNNEPVLWNSSLLEFRDKYLLIGNTQNTGLKNYAFIDQNTFAQVGQTRSFPSKVNFDFRTIKLRDKNCAVFFTKHASYRSGIVLQTFNIHDDLTIKWNTDRNLLEPIEDWLGGYVKTRAEKNWMPFVHRDELYFVYSVNPHNILRFNEHTKRVQLVYTSSADFSAWPHKALGLYGNATCTKINDDLYMGTFHSKPHRNYWSGYYFFEAKPPFKVVKVGTVPLFQPSDLDEPQRSDRVRRCFDNVQFPICTLRKDNDVLVSYGVNDCLQYIAKIGIDELLKNTVTV